MTANSTADDYDETEYSRDLQISTEGRENIRDLKDLPDSPFENADMKEVYVMAAAYGYRNNEVASETSTGSTGFVQRKALNDDQEYVMEAIAVAHEETPMVLKDQELVAEVAQRYALGGLEALIEQCKAADEPRAELISEVNAAR